MRLCAALVLLQPIAAALLQPLRLLTFDLDDCLFPCGRVVHDANAALTAALGASGVPAEAAANIQGRMKAVRAQLTEEPVTYTDLRKLGIRSLLEDAAGAAPTAAAVDAAFSVWLDERQAAADRHLYPGTVDALRRIRAAHAGLLIGAVTNGRGDPASMPSLAPWFDFALSGEERGVFPDRKPSAGIYEAALGRAASLAADADADAGGAVREPTAGSERVEVLRRSWVHVGDSLVNDVRASSACGAATVWLEHPPAGGEEPTAFSAAFSTVGAAEAARRAAEAESALASGVVGVRIEALADLPAALEQLASGAMAPR